jgi:hypothetical protein
MGPETQDKPGHVQDDNWRPAGIGKDEARDMEARAVAGADQDQAAQQEKDQLHSTTGGDSESPSNSNKPADTVGEGYKEFGSSDKKPSKLNRLKARMPSSKLKRRILFGAAGGLIGGALTLGAFFFGFMNIFKLDHFLSNVEKRAFIRWQVDMDGRSNKWIQAYLTLRLGEVDDPELQPKDRDNIVFRSNQIDAGNPVVNWFRTLRGEGVGRNGRAADFESRVFNEAGIKFSSFAYKEDSMVKFRPAVIQIDDRRLTFTPTNAEIAAIERGDVNAFNGRLREFVEIKVFENDKQARQAIKKTVNDRLKPWQVYKKRQLRKDIQNMTGVRDWRFFEKTRAAYEEKIISVRNKIILKAMPENTKSGKFVKCIFGIETCRSSPDPSHPDNKSPLSTGNGDFSDGKDSDGMRKQFLSKIVNRLNIFTNIAASLETLNNVDQNMRNGSLSKMVAAARAAQAIGLFQVYSTAKDQLKTGEVNTPEVSEFMKYANNLGSNEAWSEVLGGSSNIAYSRGTAYAAAKTAENKEEYCSEEYQTLIDAGKTDRSEFAHNCNTIGSSSRAAEIEDKWTNGPMGKILGPVLGAYRATPLDDIVGGILGAIGDAIGFVVTPAVKGALSVLGLQDDVDGAVKWMANSAVDYLGAGPQTDKDTPSQVEGNYVLQGGAASAESTARAHGAPLTTPTTRQESISRVNAYLQGSEESQSFTQKYFALSNTDSTASKQLFAVATSPTLSSPGAFVSSIFNSIGSLPGKILNTNYASAQTNTQKPYAASEFAEIDTYDLPMTCLNRDVFSATPANSTNADELGIIPADELTWDIVSSHDDFYSRLYQNDPEEDKALQVYNCELFDNGVRGSLGAMYGYKEQNAIESSAGTTGSGTTGGTTTPGVTVDPNQLGRNSANLDCAAGTRDLGVVTTRYTGELKKESGPLKIRLCQITDIPGYGNDTSGNTISGGAVVDARVSGAWAALAKAAKDDGVPLEAGSSFRLADSCGGTGDGDVCARPGQSPHQTGLAIDFGNGMYPHVGPSTTDCSLRIKLPSNPSWNWLYNNGDRFGIKQYTKEAWHWDLMPMSNRCGKDD